MKLNKSLICSSLILILLFSLPQSFAAKVDSLNAIERVCMENKSQADKKLKVDKDKLKDFCLCVKRNMKDEFSQDGDEVYLNVIADFETAASKSERNDVTERLDTLEGAYVFMDLYLDIRKECLANPSVKASRRVSSVKSGK